MVPWDRRRWADGKKTKPLVNLKDSSRTLLGSKMKSERNERPKVIRQGTMNRQEYFSFYRATSFIF